MCLGFGTCYGVAMCLPNYLTERMHPLLLASISSPITVLYLLPVTVDLAALRLSVNFLLGSRGRELEDTENRASRDSGCGKELGEEGTTPEDKAFPSLAEQQVKKASVAGSTCPCHRDGRQYLCQVGPYQVSLEGTLQRT